MRKSTVALLARVREKENAARIGLMAAEKEKGTECKGTPPLPTCVKLQLVTGQRLERELVTLEAGVQQRSLHPQGTISRHIHLLPGTEGES
jgi:hypothetical protein